MLRYDIASAVGRQPALNSLKDQKTVIDLLNRVLPEDGGPARAIPQAERPGVASPELIAAIVQFQTKNVPASFRDGRVDPHEATIRKLNELARSFFPVDPLVFPKDDPVVFSQPIEPTPVQKRLSDSFKIRLLGSLSGGVSALAGDTQYFHIWDPANGVASVYFRAAAGAQLPIPKLPGSFTIPGPWNSFTTKKPRNVGAFGGVSSFGSYGGLAWTKNMLSINVGPGDEFVVVNPMETGFTIGVGGSGTLGPFVKAWWYGVGTGGVSEYTG